MVSGRRLLALLAAVERGLSAPAASDAEAEGLLETAYDAGELAQHRASVMGAPPKALIRWSYCWEAHHAFMGTSCLPGMSPIMFSQPIPPTTTHACLTPAGSWWR